jgi:hypothetical protein
METGPPGSGTKELDPEEDDTVTKSAAKRRRRK